MEQKIREFWSHRGILNYLLLPLSATYYLVFKLMSYFALNRKVKAQVICVGNLTAGGAGKTPFCIALAKNLKKEKRKVAFVSRGYKGPLSNKNFVTKVHSRHSYRQVGDEPILLSKIAPTYICADRYKAARRAALEGAEIIIMDDGLQNHALHKDKTIVLIDSSYGLGNEFLLPAGPLREPFRSALNKADEIYSIGTTKLKNAKKYGAIHLDYEIADAKKYKNKSFITMCGIANPNKFLETLKSIAANSIEHFTFPDHHEYSIEDLKDVINCAAINKCKILTTSKDYIKIPQNVIKHFEVLEISIKL
jgi:tetraacyldisaccharide 4'-kinase